MPLDFIPRRGGLLGTSGGVDAEEVEGFLLDGGWSGVEDELAAGVEGRGDGVLRQRCEVGEEALEAVDRETVRGRAAGLFGDGRGRALRLGDDAGARAQGLE